MVESALSTLETSRFPEYVNSSHVHNHHTKCIEGVAQGVRYARLEGIMQAVRIPANNTRCMRCISGEYDY